LHCDSSILVKEHAIFVVGAKYHLEISENKQSITFTCNQWVNEGTGICVLVSIPTSVPIVNMVASDVPEAAKQMIRNIECNATAPEVAAAAQ
jgi:hypothetical protein